MSTDPRLVRPLWRGRTNVDALTIACIEHAERIARKRLERNGRGHLAHQFVVTQGSYQRGAGDPDSGTTHDLGGAADARWCGHPECLWALRKAGMAAWHRTPRQGPWPDHIHAVVVGHPYLSNAAQEQVDDYLAGRNGLANNGPDDGPRISPIPRPVWPWPPTLPQRVLTYLVKSKRELDRLRAARASARVRGEKVDSYTKAIKKLRASRKAARQVPRR